MSVENYKDDFDDEPELPIWAILTGVVVVAIAFMLAFTYKG